MLKSLLVALTLFFLPVTANASCLIAGDSIGVGLSWYLKECQANVKVGIPSSGVLKRARKVDTLIISAGSNDPYNKNLEKNLRKIRAFSKKKAIWIIPQNKRASKVVLKVALEYNDMVVFFKAGKDGVHPKSYKSLANYVRKFL